MSNAVMIEEPANNIAPRCDCRATSQPRERQQSTLAETTRLEALSDGAFAIIITLLVVEIHRPGATRGKLAEELLKEWSSYLAYAVAFLYVGVI
jgi:uncharacterized membrane protein